jgi:hypothetical protein
MEKALKMQLKALIARPSHTHLFQNPTQRPLSLFPRFRAPLFPSNISISSKTLTIRRNRITTACISPTEELIDNDPEISGENDGGVVSVSEKLLEVVEGGESGSEGGQSIWNQMLEIVKFSGPATGLWICGPMSLIDTVVIGQGSSIELAALGSVFSWEFGVVLELFLCFVAEKMQEKFLILQFSREKKKKREELGLKLTCFDCFNC